MNRPLYSLLFINLNSYASFLLYQKLKLTSISLCILMNGITVLTFECVVLQRHRNRQIFPHTETHADPEEVGDLKQYIWFTLHWSCCNINNPVVVSSPPVTTRCTRPWRRWTWIMRSTRASVRCRWPPTSWLFPRSWDTLSRYRFPVLVRIL